MSSLPLNTSSISNAYREGGSALQRNASTIEKARETRNAEQNKRREELQKRIEETRTKLQNIGYKSMKGSQSINDLSSLADSPSQHPSGTQTLPRQRKADEDRTPEQEAGAPDGTSLRRACSLSDLNKPNVARRILPSPPNNVSGKKLAGAGSHSRPSSRHGSSSETERPDRTRLQERRKSLSDDRRHSIKSPMGDKPVSRLEQHERMLAERERERREGARSAGLGNRQPSRSDLRSKSEDAPDPNLPSYMRSTSASVNKEAAVASRKQEKGYLNDRIRRKSSSYSKSTNDLRGPTRDEETSSEDDSRSRKRSASQDRKMEPVISRPGPLRAKSERDLTRVAKVKVGSGGLVSTESTSSQSINNIPAKLRTKMKTTTLISNDGGAMVVNPQPLIYQKGSEAVDVTRARLTMQLAQRTNFKMQESADDLVKLYKRVSLDDDLDDQLRAELLSQLAHGASQTLNTLKLVCESPDSSAVPDSYNHSLAKQATQQQPQQQQQQQQQSQDLASNPYFQHMLENYSKMIQGQGTQPPPAQSPRGNKGPGGPSWC